MDHPQMQNQQAPPNLEDTLSLSQGTEALAAELPPGRMRKQVRRLAVLLQSNPSADELRHSKNPLARSLMKSLSVQSSGTVEISDVEATLHQLSLGLANRRQWLQVCAYPAAVAIVAFIVFVFLSHVIVREFKTMFDEFGLSLPPVTQVVISLATEVLFHPFYFFLRIAIVASLIVFTLWFLRRSLQHWVLPGWFLGGNNIHLQIMADLSRQASRLIQDGMGPIETLHHVSEHCQHLGYQKRLNAFGTHLQETSYQETSQAGHDLKTGLPVVFSNAFTMGLSQQQSASLLSSLADGYQDRIQNRYVLATGSWAHVGIILIGLLVGFTVVSLFAPLVSLVSGLS